MNMNNMRNNLHREQDFSSFVNVSEGYIPYKAIPIRTISKCSSRSIIPAELHMCLSEYLLPQSQVCNKFFKFRRLLICRCFVACICTGIMTEKPFDIHIRQFCNFLICSTLSSVASKPKSVHSGIKRNMNFSRLALFLSCF